MDFRHSETPDCQMYIIIHMLIGLYKYTFVCVCVALCTSSPARFIHAYRSSLSNMYATFECDTACLGASAASVDTFGLFFQ